MDSDFFAAPVRPGPPAAWSPQQTPLPQQPAQAPRRRAVPVVAIVIAVAALALAGVTVTAGSMLTRHETKSLDSRSAAYDAVTQSDLQQMAAKEQAYFAEKNTYGSAQEVGGSVLPGPTGTQITVFYDDTSFCLQGAHLGSPKAWYYSSAVGQLPLGRTCS